MSFINVAFLPEEFTYEYLQEEFFLQEEFTYEDLKIHLL